LAKKGRGDWKQRGRGPAGHAMKKTRAAGRKAKKKKTGKGPQERGSISQKHGAVSVMPAIGGRKEFKRRQ